MAKWSHWIGARASVRCCVQLGLHLPNNSCPRGNETQDRMGKFAGWQNKTFYFLHQAKLQMLLQEANLCGQDIFDNDDDGVKDHKNGICAKTRQKMLSLWHHPMIMITLLITREAGHQFYCCFSEMPIIQECPVRNFGDSNKNPKISPKLHSLLKWSAKTLVFGRQDSVKYSVIFC